MNATDILQLVNWFEKEIVRTKESIERIKSKCSHVNADGSSTVAFHEVFGCPGPYQSGKACKVCLKWIELDEYEWVKTVVTSNVP